MISVNGSLPVQTVIGFPVTALPFRDQIATMIEWASQRLSQVVCVANVHMVMEAQVNPAFEVVLDNVDLVTPDGMPLVWMMRLLGARQQERVAGMDIFLALCHEAPKHNISVFLLGSQKTILDRMSQRLTTEFPDLKIAGTEPLPFRPLTVEENQATLNKIHQSGAGLVLVSLGCPKQEIWMAQQKGKLQAVMIGLGGVFPIYAGLHKLAPQWVRNRGLEWAYRLLQEPGRLWKRYATTIPPFIYLALKQLLTTNFRVQDEATKETCLD